MILKSLKNAEEQILELWMSREEPQLNLLQSQMLVKEKSMLHQMTLMDESDRQISRSLLHI